MASSAPREGAAGRGAEDAGGDADVVIGAADGPNSAGAVETPAGAALGGGGGGGVRVAGAKARRHMATIRAAQTSGLRGPCDAAAAGRGAMGEVDAAEPGGGEGGGGTGGGGLWGGDGERAMEGRGDERRTGGDAEVQQAGVGAAAGSTRARMRGAGKAAGRRPPYKEAEAGEGRLRKNGGTDRFPRVTSAGLQRLRLPRWFYKYRYPRRN